MGSILWIAVVFTAVALPGCDCLFGEDEYPPPLPALVECAQSTQWQDRSCAEICGDYGYPRCVENSDACSGAVAWGYPDQATCAENRESVEVAASCAAPLSAGLEQDSVEFVRCCCG